MKARILVVDDEPTVLSTMKIILQTKGHDVVTSPSAAEARALLAAEDFDLVMTDMRMETDLAGYDVVQAAKQRPATPAVIIMTAVPLLASEWRTRGVDAVFAKPPNIEELLRTIETLVSTRAQGTATPEQDDNGLTVKG